MGKEKNDIQAQQTMEDFLLSQLEQPVVLKDGTKLRDSVDGHELTKQEAIAVNIINNAMKGDVRAAQYIQNIQTRAQFNNNNKR